MDSAGVLSVRERVVLLCVGFCLIVMLATMIIARIANPSLVQNTTAPVTQMVPDEIG